MSEERISKVEKDTSTLKTEVSHIKDVVDDVMFELKNLSTIISKKGQVSWPIIIGCGTLVVTSLAVMITVIAIIGNMALTPVKNDMSRIEQEHQRVEERIMKRVDEKIYYLEKRNNK